MRCSSRSTPPRSPGASGSDVYAFVTSNYRDFSVPNGDRRQPHPDLAGLFDGTRSRYAYQIEGLHEVLLEQFGDEYLEEQTEVEFLTGEEEPRTLAEIIEAEQEFFDKVWYVRSIAYHDDERELPDDIRTGMMANRERAEAAYGRDELRKARRATEGNRTWTRPDLDTTKPGSTATSAGSWARSDGSSAASGISWTPE